MGRYTRSRSNSAERLGFASVSTFERLLIPAPPEWRNVYGLPDYPAYDALETLTWVAAHTQRVRLVTGVLISLFEAPVVLARRLATLDHLSAGRVVAGIGQGWMPEEFAAVGVPARRRGAGFEEHLAAMRACWAPDPVECDGPRYPIPRSKIGPKPVNGRIPVLIGGVAPAAIARAARLGDGFIAVCRDWESCRGADHVLSGGGRGRSDRPAGRPDAGGRPTRHRADRLDRAKRDGRSGPGRSGRRGRGHLGSQHRRPRSPPSGRRPNGARREAHGLSRRRDDVSPSDACRRRYRRRRCPLRR
ncbi:MAG: TIGR03619 family F420-dependent LLM class oxidoreductase [Chloroflexi bacterium]|nr:TIGR03619 family F420-dependent LLM class oxidoreductase [Chloroflexota bacterium]